MSLVRAFIAIEIPKNLQENIQVQTAGLREKIDSTLVKWVVSKNIHLTLKFLGDVPQTNLSFIKQMLMQTASLCQPFDIQLTQLGSFPNSRRPRVFWVGVQAPGALEVLHREVESASARMGYTPEPSRFSPHLTLGRVRPNLSPAGVQNVSDALENTYLQKLGNATISEIHLYQSDLQPSGSVYTKLFSAPFHKPK